MSDHSVVTGQRWYERDGGSEASAWRVCAVRLGLPTAAGGDTVSLSGPGPCRAYQVVALDVFLRDWALVVRDGS